VDDDEVFLGLRPDLFGLVYRMLGTVADAEDVLQEGYLRWRAADRGDVQSPGSYLTTSVARLSVDCLTSARARRERYVGPWLPEPLLVHDSDPARVAELADSPLKPRWTPRSATGY
jgi:RNA polymerase sigma-70 factor, ECF subfamily